jgi:hypothetical protein
MAFGANHELPSSRRKRILAKDAMHIVAICAVDQTLFYLVMRGHGELWLDVGVALEAELGLLHLEQMLRRAGSMDGVAADAAYIALAVGRTLEVSRPAMACLTFFIHLFGRGLRWIEDSGSFAAIHVCFAGAMTAFAGHAITAMRQRRPAVRIFNKVLHDLLVARRAGGCALKVVWDRLTGRVAVGLGFVSLSRHCCCAKHRRAQKQHETALRAASLSHDRTHEPPQHWQIAMHQFSPRTGFMLGMRIVPRSPTLCTGNRD